MERATTGANTADPAYRIRALVVDDSTVALDAICTLLTTRKNILVVGTATNGKDALLKAESLQPDLVLMDMEMPEVTGLEATTQLRTRFPNIRVIVVTVHDSIEVKLACDEADANGFVSKSRLYSSLFAEIDKVFGAQQAL